MAGDELPARGNLGPESTDPSSPGAGGEALSGTSAGSGTGMEGIGTNAAAGAEDAGTAAGTGQVGTRAGAEEGAVGSGYGGPGTPGAPTGTPSVQQSETQYDTVTQSSMDSFPASDPPTY